MIKLIEDNDLVIVVKLCTGEQLLAVLSEDEETFLELKYPLEVKSVPVIDEDGSMSSSTVLTPWCPYSDDRYYRIDKKNFLFNKKVHPVFVQQYVNLVDYYFSEKEAKKDREGYYQEVTSDEDLESAVDRLELILEGKVQAEDYVFFVDGTDTKH